MTKITFKNVPLNVPDEEILTLCACYGRLVDSEVHYERLNNIKGAVQRHNQMKTEVENGERESLYRRRREITEAKDKKRRPKTFVTGPESPKPGLGTL